MHFRGHLNLVCSGSGITHEVTSCKQSLSAALSEPTETAVHTDSGVTSVGLVTQIM